MKMNNRNEIILELAEIIIKLDIKMNHHLTVIKIFINENGNGRIYISDNLKDDGEIVYIDNWYESSNIIHLIPGMETIFDIIGKSREEMQGLVLKEHPDETEVMDFDIEQYILQHDRYKVMLEDAVEEWTRSEINDDGYNYSDYIQKATELVEQREWKQTHLKKKEIT